MSTAQLIVVKTQTKMNSTDKLGSSNSMSSRLRFQGNTETQDTQENISNVFQDAQSQRKKASHCAPDRVEVAFFLM